ncbi:chemotaxis protein CheW [Piscibacillus halophilus]|uniref:Purine-binding chemotaxis protein CheW n=1 Tax=Piscibacillus halophilus TaxID=571933 RepID=A0A1H8YZU9_9BACI|nr:chemotaxis protein CheW [Piscibacillus halophilus]SEP57710.1 purine-binding chemotaxis protein CheW [Piscibacillus halophilus]
MENQKFIVFKLDQEFYAIPVRLVQSIERIQSITRVPNTKSFVKGIMNLRGIITPVIDLRERLKLNAKAEDDHTRVIIAHLQDDSTGLIVDEANDVIEIDESNIKPTPETFDQVQMDYITGVIKDEDRLIVLLDLNQIFNSELVQLVE